MTISFPESLFPLTSGRKTRALGATISGVRHRCRLRSETGWAEFGYFKMVAPSALVFRPLVKGNEDSGNEIETVKKWSIESGTIIGDGDRKRALFLVLGLSPWYGTIFLFLEQIAPSCAVHARTRCEDFCGCSAGKWRPKFPKYFDTFGPQLNTFMSVGIFTSVFSS